MFKPNAEQSECIAQIYQFIGDNKAFSRFLINGSAGTGKTSILISSIINHFISEIAKNPTRFDYIVKNEKWELLDELLEYFIISAPTNKAKDVLVSKYNAYLAAMKDDILCERFILNEIVHRRIDFLTVSQVLSISRVINEMGDEEFTKGNEKKIADKYNKPLYNKTFIIIDECSMIDTNTSKVLGVIKCPIIFIGDYCQLPPVGEDLSPIFQIMETSSESISTELQGINKTNTIIFRLSKVERCQQDVSMVANILRDKIYGAIPDFNLLGYKVADIIQYPKRMEKWLDTYVDEIKEKLADIKKMQFTKLDAGAGASALITKVSSGNDSMALAWTNKCCAALNQKVRNKIYLDCVMAYDAEVDNDPEFENIEDINDHFLIKGDKLLVRVPYYKYGSNIYSSSIAYVAKLQKVQYKPLSFREWCNLAIAITNADAKSSRPNMTPVFDIDINILGLLDDTPSKVQNDNKTVSKQPSKQKSVLEFLTPSTHGTSGSATETLIEDSENNPGSELQELRQAFFQFHNLGDVISTGTYEFNDIVARKYSHICNTDTHGIDARESVINLEDIKKAHTAEEREKIYTNWHRKVSTVLFGIPVERVLCRKCLFFINKFASVMNKSCNIADMINATESIGLGMYLTDLAVLTTTSNYINQGIPILDMLDKSTIDSIQRIREIIKSSYDVKIVLTKQDCSALKTINKILGEDDNTAKYITMSQMLGHYMSHVISSNYLEVDYGYAITVHKSQGSTYDDVFVEHSNLAANKKDSEKYKLLYTAITRSARKLHIYS
jgi:hypothetical protein